LSVFDEVEMAVTAGVGPRGTARSGATCVVAGCRCDGLIWPTTDLGEGGPGRDTEPADFSMLLAHRLNFLLDQARLALDPRTEHRRREWAEREIDELLHIMPTLRQLADVLAVTCDCVQAIPH
jgi:hypothetical protein